MTANIRALNLGLIASFILTMLGRNIAEVTRLSTSEQPLTGLKTSLKRFILSQKRALVG